MLIEARLMKKEQAQIEEKRLFEQLENLQDMMDLELTGQDLEMVYDSFSYKQIPDIIRTAQRLKMINFKSNKLKTVTALQTMRDLEAIILSVRRHCIYIRTINWKN
jgi:hypothetical protein